MTKKIVVPHLNINGTSKTELDEQLRKAYSAVDTAIKALCETSPHGRDYQTADYHRDSLNPIGTAYNRARKEYDSRMRKLLTVRYEILALHSGLDLQKEGKGYGLEMEVEVPDND